MLVREFTPAEYRVINRAKRAMENVLRKPGEKLDSMAVVAEYLKLTLGALPHEVFTVVFLDTQHCLIEALEMFRGTLTQTAVYPREIAKTALQLDAAAVILAHNHPSGVCEASAADRALTDSVKLALRLLDIQVLDHIIVARTQTMSFAQRGWL